MRKFGIHGLPMTFEPERAIKAWRGKPAATTRRATFSSANQQLSFKLPRSHESHRPDQAG